MTAPLPSIADLQAERNRLQALYDKANEELKDASNKAHENSAGFLTLKGVILKQMQDALEGMKAIEEQIRALEDADKK